MGKALQPIWVSVKIHVKLMKKTTLLKFIKLYTKVKNNSLKILLESIKRLKLRRKHNKDIHFYYMCPRQTIKTHKSFGY